MGRLAIPAQATTTVSQRLRSVVPKAAKLVKRATRAGATPIATPTPASSVARPTSAKMGRKVTCATRTTIVSTRPIVPEERAKPARLGAHATMAPTARAPRPTAILPSYARPVPSHSPA